MKILSQTLFETKTILSHGEQALLNLVLPMAAMVVLMRVPMPGRDDVFSPAVAYASALALSWASTAFSAQAIAVAFDRRWGVLRMLSTTPLGPRGLFAGKLGAVYIVGLVEAIVLGVVALFFGLGFSLPALAGGLLFAVVGIACFLAGGLLLGGTLRPEAVLACANLLWAVMAGVGGLLLPLDTYPHWWATLAQFTPPGALGSGMRTLATGEGNLIQPLIVLLVWTACATAGTFRWFSWDSK